MLTTEILLCVAAAIAGFALFMTIVNLLTWYRPAPASLPIPPGTAASFLISICIPARNEESNLQACIASLLASTHTNIEVLVYDDQSTDTTPQIIDALTAADVRVKRIATIPLPPRWNGKQHACHRMAAHAEGDWLLFTDADVRFAPDCLARTLAAADHLKAPLVSAFPRQITGTLGEALAIPMIFFILLSYLPFPMMKMSDTPAISAGCGQFLFVRRDAYVLSGGHAMFKDSMHDGIKLPRVLRRAGFHTDLFDGTDLCSCRMYRGFGATWSGFAKNAYEGVGSVHLLVVFTVLHLLGHVAPWVLLLLGASRAVSLTRLDVVLGLLAIGFALLQRIIILTRTRHNAALALLHPIAILVITAIQWHSYVLHLTGKRSWKGRSALL